MELRNCLELLCEIHCGQLVLGFRVDHRLYHLEVGSREIRSIAFLCKKRNWLEDGYLHSVVEFECYGVQQSVHCFVPVLSGRVWQGFRHLFSKVRSADSQVECSDRKNVMRTFVASGQILYAHAVSNLNLMTGHGK